MEKLRLSKKVTPPEQAVLITAASHPMLSKKHTNKQIK